MTKRYSVTQLEEMYLRLTGAKVKLTEDAVDDELASAVPAPDVDLATDLPPDTDPEASTDVPEEPYELPYGNLLVISLNGPEGDLEGLVEYLKEVVGDYFADREVENGIRGIDKVDNPEPEETSDVPPVDAPPVDDVPTDVPPQDDLV